MNIETSKPKVSIVVPAYNVEDYIETCLSSISRQSYKNFEVLIVDDGSTDETAGICLKWQKRDSRFHVFQQQNQGQSAARNFALDQASGEYCIIIDSDDSIHSNLLELCMRCCTRPDLDFVFFGYHSFSDSYPEIFIEPVSQYFRIVEMPVSLIVSGKIPSHPWQYFCKLSAYEGIRYPVGRKAEDVAVTYRVVSTARRAALLPDILYNYRIRANSTIGESSNDTHKAIEYYRDEYLAFSEMLNWANENHFDEFKSPITNLLFDHLFAHYALMSRNGDREGRHWVKTKVLTEAREHDSSEFNRTIKMKILFSRMGLFPLASNIGHSFMQLKRFSFILISKIKNFV